MTIRVRVASAGAVQELNKVDAAQRRVAMGTRNIGQQASWGLPYLSKWGNQVQWAGRQLMYNFTLPLGIAGIAATQWALENEKAMVRVIKVYGDGSKQFNELAKTEIPALQKAFEALSNEFGVHQAEVIGIAGDWAAAGASGLALAKSVKLTLETMVLGELSAVEATKQLIAIQAQYGFGVKELADTIDILNMVENQTGASMKDLMDGMSRAAGVARVAGVDVEHLAAMMAALTPASGSAATAGNALKTIISRILSPTEDAVELLREMGVQVDAVSWNSQDASSRIESLSKQFENLSDAQKTHMATVLGSRWQLNRLIILMQAVRNENSYYNKALDSTNDKQALFTQRQKELQAVLTSNPQAMKQAWVILQNAMTKIIVPLVPHIVYLAQELARLADAFANMNPEMQKLVLIGLLFLAVIGPMARYIGAVANLSGLLSGAFHWLSVKSGIAATTVALVDKETGELTGETKRARKGVLGLALAMFALPGSMVAGTIGIATKAIANFRKFIANPGGVFAAWIVATNLWIKNLFLVGPAIGLASKGLRALGGAIGWAAAQVRGLYTLLALGGAWTSFVVSSFTAMWTSVSAVSTAKFGTMLLSMRIAQYVWLTTTLDVFRAWVFKLGTVFSLLPVFFIESMKSLWAAMVIPGVISGTLIRIWATMAMILSVRWTQFTLFIRMTWASAMMSLGGVLAAASMKIRAIWVSLHAFLLATSIKTYFFLLALPGKLVGAFIVMAKAIPALFARFAPIIVGIVARMVAGIFAALTGPIGIAVLAVLGIAYTFRDQIANIWNNVVSMFQNNAASIAEFFQPLGDFFTDLGNRILDAFWALPKGVRDAMIAVLTIVRDTALQIYEWMSYLNPFARHSPSLVESVTAGMAAIEGQYQRVNNIGQIFANANKHLAQFKRTSNGLGEYKDDRKEVKKSGGNVGLFDALVGDLRKLEPLMARQEAAVNRQEAVVDKWADKLDEARDRLDRLTDAYNRHKDAMQNFADAPIKGMGAMNEQIWQNEMAQKRLRLEMMRWEEANGSIDDMRDRLGLLRGDIELLSGKANDLRMSGAGSDVLGPIQSQIAAMEQQAAALESTVRSSPVGDLQKQLEELQRQGEMLDLEKAVKFDPMLHEIEKLANMQKELSYEQIISGIRRERAAMEQLQPRLDAATAVHDRLQRAYDREKEKLDELNEGYGRTRDLVGEIESALSSMGSAAQQANQKASSALGRGGKGAEVGNAVSRFRAGAGGNWPDVGKQMKIGRIGGMEDQSKMIEEFAERSAKRMGNLFGGFDMFGPLKKWWSRTWDWIEENVGPVVEAVGGGLVAAWDAVIEAFRSDKAASMAQPLVDAWDTGADILRTIWEGLKAFWDLIGPDIMRIWDALVRAGKKIWNEIGPELEKFGPVFKNLGKAFKNIWKAIKPLVIILGGALLLAFEVVADVVSRVFWPVLEMVIDVAKGIIKVIRGVLEFVVGVFSGDWKMAWQGIKDIVSGTFGAIWAIIKGAAKIIWGIVSGIVMGIVDFFKWLYDILVGHSIIPDLVEAIFDTFGLLVKIGKWIWNNALRPVVDFFVKLTKAVIGKLKEWWPKIKATWNVLKKLGKWFWEVVLSKVFDFVGWLWDRVKRSLSRWWGAIKAVWNVLKKLAGWFWDNILKPIWNIALDLWERVKRSFGRWWDGIKGIWAPLTRLGAWVKNNVMDPVFDRVKAGWERVKTWLQENKGMLTNPVAGVVNAVIRGVNKLISGLNKVSDVLPGIDFHVDAIPTLAQGGIPLRRGNRGFKTTGARAIVGEGKANWPEFVIPTDPTYRRRALGLMNMAAGKLGIGLPGGGFIAGDTGREHRMLKRHMGQVAMGLPAFGLGGWLGDIKDSVMNRLPDSLPTGRAASYLFQPFKAAGKGLINGAGWKYPVAIGHYGLDQMDEWIKSLDIQLKEEFKEAKPKGLEKALRFARAEAGKPYKWGGVGPGGYDCSGFMAALMNVIDGVAIHSRRGGTGSMPWSGMHTGTQDGGFNIGWFTGSPGHTAGTIMGTNVEAAGGVGVRVGGPVGAGNSMFNHIAYYSKAANGAIVRATRNGSFIQAGEGGRDEAVLPLPRNWRTNAQQGFGGTGEKHVHIHGDLSFPNITKGTDAEELIDNLALLAD